MKKYSKTDNKGENSASEANFKVNNFIDKKDELIINALRKDARMNIAKISALTKIKRDSVAYRLNKMIGEGTLNVRVEINRKKLGNNVDSILTITLQNFSVEKEKQLEGFLLGRKEATYFAMLSGKNDCIVRISCSGQEEMNKFVYEIRSKFSDVIKEFDISNVVLEHKIDG